MLYRTSIARTLSFEVSALADASGYETKESFYVERNGTPGDTRRQLLNDDGEDVAGRNDDTLE